MAERQKLEVTVLSGQNFSSGQKDQARKNIDAAAESALFRLSAKTVSEIKTTETVTATPHTAADGTIYYELEAAPEVSDTVIKPENGLYASQQNTIWTIGISADYLSANALDSYSGNWQNAYKAVSAYSGDFGYWKTEYELVSSNSGKWNEVTAFSATSGKFALSADVSAEFTATSAWAKKTFQPSGDYLSASEKYLSANALDNLSGNWESVYNSVYDTSADWNNAYKWAKDNSANIIDASATLKANSASWNETSAALAENSGHWDSVYESVLANSASWNETSATLNTNSGKWEQAFTAVSSNSGYWDSVYNSVLTNSASWNETSATLKENSGKWEESYTALTATSAIWNNHSALSATKLDKDVFDTWKTDEFEPVKTDVETLKANSAHYPVESTNEYITVNSANHKFALTFVSGDLATKTWVEGRLGEFGGYVPCEGTGDDKHPAVVNPDSKKMYLVPKDDTTEPDRYYNWIVTGNETTGWLCVGDTSMDLTPYLKISDISGISGNWNTAYTYVTANSGNIAEASATAIDVSNTVNTYSSNWQESYEALTSTSADWNKTYTYVTANSANIESVSSTVNANSGKWNEASAFSANSGKFVTSGDEIANEGLAYVIKKTGDVVAWSGIDFSDLGKMYPITSLTPDIVSATISAVDGTSAYVLSAKEPDSVEYFNISADKMSAWSGTEDNIKYYFLSGANISGNNGISAEYNPQINQWDIGLNNPSYNYAVARTDITTLTATSETISGFVDIDAAGITFENDVVTLDKGLYHVDIQVNVPVNDIDESYYEVTLTPSLSYAVLRQTIDASYAHNTTLDLSFDINLLTDGNELTFTLAGLPVGARYKVENFQIHEVTTIDSLIDIDGGIYHAGVATQIDGQNNINVEFNPASGIDVDANNKLYVKLGKGLKFDTEGAAEGTLTLDNVTEEVVDTVRNLKAELDNKLTMNMNYSDAKKVGSPVSDIDGAGACMVASLFHVNLTHEINENTELTIYCSQACPQSDVLPYMFGVFEYNFNYYDNDPSSPTYGTYRPQTTWLFDTGILNATIPANKYTMKVKNIRPVTSYSGQDAQGNIWVNDYKAEMRSDRLYYAAMFCRQKTSNFYLLCDEGYEANTNSNPKITWFNDNMKYCGPLSASVPANIADWGQWGSTAWEAVKDTMTFNDVNWWGNNTSEPDNTYREKNTAYRYLLQLRNNNTNVGGN